VNSRPRALDAPAACRRDCEVRAVIAVNMLLEVGETPR
jgi:hypothetical protein